MTTTLIHTPEGEIKATQPDISGEMIKTVICLAEVNADDDPYAQAGDIGEWIIDDVSPKARKFCDENEIVYVDRWEHTVDYSRPIYSDGSYGEKV